MFDVYRESSLDNPGEFEENGLVKKRFIISETNGVRWHLASYAPANAEPYKRPSYDKEIDFAVEASQGNHEL